jgi:hypothetical protein
MKGRRSFLESRHIMWLVMCGMMLYPALSHPASFVAFVQPDPTTSKVPYEAFSITRLDGSTMDSRSPIQACDRVSFVTTQTQYQSVYVTTLRGGKNIRLDAAHPSVKLSCDEPSHGELFARWWRDISGGERATYSIAALTRGDQFAVAILTSDQSNLVASGARPLFIEWSGGTPPYRMVLTNSSTGLVVAKIDDLTGHSLRTQPLDLQPGQYSLSVFNTPKDGSAPELREDHIFVVSPGELPAPPQALRDAKLDDTDKELLYIYYLEGFGDGRWALEAMQRAAAISPPTSASKAWLAQYGGD